jgi:hypothetical protein
MFKLDISQLEPTNRKLLQASKTSCHHLTAKETSDILGGGDLNVNLNQYGSKTSNQSSQQNSTKYVNKDSKLSFDLGDGVLSGSIDANKSLDLSLKL